MVEELKKRSIVVVGQTITLIERRCLGCKRTWDVTESSTSLYHSRLCEQVNTDAKYDFKRGALLIEADEDFDLDDDEFNEPNEDSF